MFQRRSVFYVHTTEGSASGSEGGLLHLPALFLVSLRRHFALRFGRRCWVAVCFCSMWIRKAKQFVIDLREKAFVPARGRAFFFARTGCKDSLRVGRCSFCFMLKSWRQDDSSRTEALRACGQSSWSSWRARVLYTGRRLSPVSLSQCFPGSRKGT